MEKISGVKVPKLKAPKESMPKAPKKQARPSSSVSKGTFGAEMRKVQKRAKPKAGKISVI